MRHKYVSRAIVLARNESREYGITLTLLTEDFGLVRARAEGLRKPGAKLASALQTLSESDVTLLRGKEGWRLTGALLCDNHFSILAPTSRDRAGRVASLLLRMSPSDAQEVGFFAHFADFLRALPVQSDEEQDTAECHTVFALLVLLGLDSGAVPEGISRSELVVRINRGISASGL